MVFPRSTVRVLLVFFGLIFCGLCFAAQSAANPLLGTWIVTKIEASDLITQVSIDRYKALQPKEIIFRPKEMAVIPKEGKEHAVPAYYREETKGVWSFSVDEGDTWNEMRFSDPNTLIRTEKKNLDVVITYTLVRKQ